MAFEAAVVSCLCAHLQLWTSVRALKDRQEKKMQEKYIFHLNKIIKNAFFDFLLNCSKPVIKTNIKYMSVFSLTSQSVQIESIVNFCWYNMHKCGIIYLF